MDTHTHTHTHTYTPTDYHIPSAHVHQGIITNQCEARCYVLQFGAIFNSEEHHKIMVNFLIAKESITFVSIYTIYYVNTCWYHYIYYYHHYACSGYIITSWGNCTNQLVSSPYHTSSQATIAGLAATELLIVLWVGDQHVAYTDSVIIIAIKLKHWLATTKIQYNYGEV